LRRIGVTELSVEEVYSLDPDSLASLGSIHGFIFLFRHREEQEADAPEMICPPDIWFANQVIDNACASLALLNIVFNIENAQIGKHLAAFKDFTKDFTPSLRGITLSNFDHLRKLHNTFARKSEMASSDLGLMHAVKNRNRRGADEDYEDCFHFIAYIYKRGHLWELDGLKKTPVRLDNCNRKTWTTFAAAQMQNRMERYTADEIRFNLLALCQDPVVALNEKLEMRKADLALELDDGNATVVAKLSEEIRLAEQDLAERRLREAEYQGYSERRRHDYRDFSKRFLELLHAKGALQSMLD
jgi:ubiquitin carboxyl-terminal hydrolase L5